MEGMVGMEWRIAKTRNSAIAATAVSVRRTMRPALGMDPTASDRISAG